MEHVTQYLQVDQLKNWESLILNHHLTYFKQQKWLEVETKTTYSEFCEDTNKTLEAWTNCQIKFHINKDNKPKVGPQRKD